MDSKLTKITTTVVALVCGVCTAGDLQPFELAGYKLGAFASDYDEEGMTMPKRKLKDPFCGFDELEYVQYDNRVTQFRLKTEPVCIPQEEREKKLNELVRLLKLKMRGSTWKQVNKYSEWTFTSHEGTVEGLLHSYVVDKVYYKLYVSLVDPDNRNYSGHYSNKSYLPYLSKVQTFAEPKTFPVTNMFGVTLGMSIEDVKSSVGDVKPFKKKGERWNYEFQPKKKFRSFDVYKLDVQSGIVKAIQACQRPGKGQKIDNIQDVLDILRKKYRSNFSWESNRGSGASEDQKAKHVGYGDDYTIIEVVHNVEHKTLSVRHSLTITLTKDFHRAALEQMSVKKKQEEKRKKEMSESRKYEGIDAL